MARRFVSRSAFIVFLVIFVLASVPAAGAPPGPDSLQQDTQGSLTITRDATTGAVTFVRGLPGIASGTTAAQLASGPYGTALTFLVRYEQALGMPDLSHNLVGQEVVVDELGMTHVRFRQVHRGVTVFAAEIIDMTNGAGNDTPPVAWLMGEDLPGIGAIRSMADPPQFGDPDRVSAYVCTSSDNGGVHTNSGIPNKAAYLMAAGGTFNGRTVSGIGLDKMGRVQYRSLTQYLTASATFVDVYNALNQSCLDLVGTAGITTADCTQVDTALLAVEMNTAPSCTGGGCVIQETTGDRSLFTSPAETIQLTLLMYQVREQVLRGTPAGDHFIDLYYRHSAAVTGALARDPHLRYELAAFLRGVAPGLEALRAQDRLRAESVTVSQETIVHLHALLAGLVAADPTSDLAQAIHAELAWSDLDVLAGQSYAAAWQRMNDRLAARE